MMKRRHRIPDHERIEWALVAFACAIIAILLAMIAASLALAG